MLNQASTKSSIRWASLGFHIGKARVKEDMGSLNPFTLTFACVLFLSGGLSVSFIQSFIK